MDYLQMTSPCGMDCFNCPAYLANEDMTIRAGLAEKLGLPLAAAQCSGCRNANGIITFLGDKTACDVFRCTTGQGITYCHECLDFPCDHLHPYADKALERPHNTKIFNLGLIKKMGVDQWARTKAPKVRKNYFNGTLKVHAVDKKST